MNNKLKKVNFTVLTLFPELIESFFSHGMVGRAIANNIISASAINIRNFAFNKHNSVDDRPYGGGCGMVMRPEPLAVAIRDAKESCPESKVILMSPQGTPFNQETACKLASAMQGLIFVCGRYEGVDERVISQLIDDEISIGDYVMTGGELASMVIIDTVIRLIPGVLGGDESAEMDSFRNGRLEHAHYTRPPIFEEIPVPDVLLSGNHKKIELWREESSLKRTFLKRPDLFEKDCCSNKEKAILRQWHQELKDWSNKIEKLIF
ncbi:MAG: tRNA (guanosine(37)-N1)-methyltransferase TrmD [Desulfamplus sp.]|nr:tRNA (guanosine(37)-N1)-methyltransferase TrmD [Desulfamplus sp.]